MPSTRFSRYNKTFPPFGTLDALSLENDPTISGLMAASVDELEAIPVKESKLGRELAVALKRVFE